MICTTCGKYFHNWHKTNTTCYKFECMEDSKKPSQGEVSQLKKMIIVSPETHTSLFLLKLKMQKHNEGSVTFKEVIDRLIEEHYKIYRMEEKE